MINSVFFNRTLSLINIKIGYANKFKTEKAGIVKKKLIIIIITRDSILNKTRDKGRGVNSDS